MLIRCYFFLDLTAPRVQKTTARVKNRAGWNPALHVTQKIRFRLISRMSRDSEGDPWTLIINQSDASLYKSKNKRFRCCFENVYHVLLILTLTPRSEFQRRGRLIVHIKHLDVNHVRLYTTHVQMHHQSLKIIDPSMQLWRVSIPFVSEKKCDGSL